jgi:hypothetical protein
VSTTGGFGHERTPILICYDGSADAQRTIKTAATLLGSRRAVVLDIAPLLTSAESIAAMSSVVPGDAFEETNVAEARRVAERGAEIALASGFEAEREAISPNPPGRESWTWPTSCTLS